jgi:hypothetical protein
LAHSSAAETLGRLLENTNPGIRIHEPRFLRLATDQTANVLAGDFQLSEVLVLAAARAGLADRIDRTSK